MQGRFEPHDDIGSSIQALYTELESPRKQKQQKASAKPTRKRARPSSSEEPSPSDIDTQPNKRPTRACTRLHR